ncbi:VPLPA-CTERM sorting domain-containing protein [Thiocapsa imhoffii]|uniref:VPLPA-CTERM sorting domain-containing protein n=1 Tax=Thiocapsa imhoffii TaxID=382777 RepID=UPI0019030045|nr:VPLPA-CTERM sorting domain-containing protein [Thiocapsa imhoffii]
MTKTIFYGLALIAASAFGSVSQASSLLVFNSSGAPIKAGGGPNATQYWASCQGDNCMQGIHGTQSAPIFSSESVTGFNIGPASEANELSFLNNLLATSSLSQPPVTFVQKTDVAGNSFTTNREYFSIKQQTWTAYFKNTSGGEITIDFGPNSWSHFTEYGNEVAPVPLPAAAWLFGSALLGLVGVGYRRKRARSA